MSRQPVFNAEPAFVLVATTAFIAGMGWALGVLRRAVDFPSFIVLGACGIAQAAAAVQDMLDSIGDTCPECPPNE